LLSTWTKTEETVPSAGGELHRYIYTDPVTHLKVTAEVRTFAGYPAVDWVLKFRNDGTADSPILENILPLHWTTTPDSDCTVRHAKGSAAHADDFEPLEEHFGPGGSDHLESSGGYSSSINTLPFFNLQTGDHGVIAAIGWTGNWKTDFRFDRGTKALTVTAGMRQTHLLLHPGEEIRTPRIVLMNWSGGDWMMGQNAWRRLLLSYYSPQDKGKPMIGPVLFGSWGSEEIDKKIAMIQWVHDHQLPFDMYAVDAGWYGGSIGAENGGASPWWKNRGDWFPSPLYYPNGIKPLGEALKANGLGFSLWIEPETAMDGLKIVRDHPDWFLHSDHPVNPGLMLANLGDPVVRQGLTDMVSHFITDFGMTWYRQDFNMPPEEYWTLADTPNRIGMTEIGHIEGLYAMWDELLAKHPGLRIDNCASGGRRMDIEMMSRSFVIWRTDHGFLDTIAEQAQTQALAPWNPQTMAFSSYTVSKPWEKPGPYSTPESLYLCRLGYANGYGIGPGATGLDNAAWVAWVKQLLGEYREVQPYLYADFYPLLSYSLAGETWTAWQWDRPEQKDGLLMILRRPDSPFTGLDLVVRDVDPAAQYAVEFRTGLEKVPVKQMSGGDLAHLHIDMADRPGSELIFYRKL
jgi:alpha-galactosidase